MQSYETMEMTFMTAKDLLKFNKTKIAENPVSILFTILIF